jgi:hypothetical protein
MFLKMNDPRLEEGTAEHAKYTEQLKKTAAERKRRQAWEDAKRAEQAAENAARTQYKAEPAEIKGLKAIRVKDSKYYSVKDGKDWLIFDSENEEIICIMRTKKEAAAWLMKSYSYEVNA